MKAELLEMVLYSSDELSHEVEAECLGFNSSNLHPDVYMNKRLRDEDHSSGLTRNNEIQKLITNSPAQTASPRHTTLLSDKPAAD